ncbi:hypothetical protein RclHR1_09910008 [Rhizophagus clarus]|uniref:BED-type domain-containing protein n=1 Tax=Rhizophagus clarus TaxID=94130 RepID=A0A2Z6QBI1_9GLOM|nr:hypothetical protein RclHR1_01090031 [Rhizophagus clarus]GBB87533.1 hypothetical protein RclHR1_00140037 [Rhizophagus clarus]GBB94504.1 hypothetical protein RclHR1_02370004 [Rhizophagus clarus]GBC10799.1 hypothetical protein RclHR1_09910008 [Rhizophagus clarus]
MPLNKTNKRTRQIEPEQNFKSKVGRPQDSVWEHFIKTPLSTAGHFAAECLYCEKKWTRGRPQELQVHLAKDCLNVDEETRREYIQKILQLYNDDDTEDNKRFRIEQLNITDFWDVDQNSVEPLSKQKQEAIDQCLLKAFVCCGTPFAVVENPFFVDLIRKLQPGYKLPSREKLAGIMLSHAVVRIEDQVNSILGKATNLTLGLDGWTNPSGHSIYNFIIMTHDRREFLYRLRDLSIIKHTAQNLASEIEDVLQKIGPDKFAAVVTDNAANCALARSIISEKYPFIVNTRCIAHCVNLITKDVLEHNFPKKVLKSCNEIVKFFNKSHQGKALLVADDHKDVVKENIVKIITSRGFFHDVNVVLKVLEPLKKTILSVEASNTTFADCFIALIRLASTIKKIPVERGLVNFQNHVINSINKRWESFNVMPYILAYFLHPGYRGNGLKNMWTKISEYAQKLWENMGYNIDDQEILITQMLNFKAKQGTYSTAFVKNRVTPCTWWMSCEDQPPFLRDLALKVFAVTPHSASCERMFSVLGWLYGKKRTTLDTNTIESIAKVRHFYQNNNMHLAESNSRQNNDDIQKLIDESAFFEIENDNDDHEGEGGYEEYFEEVEIPKHNVYVLIEEYVDLAILENDE